MAAMAGELMTKGPVKIWRQFMLKKNRLMDRRYENIKQILMNMAMNENNG